jgi:exosome complex RNA-binding protein Rrp42 (RNase PH superfamily)
MWMNAGGVLDWQSLCIVSGRTVWVLCVEALILAIDGSVLDALSIAVKVRFWELQEQPFAPEHVSRSALQ